MSAVVKPATSPAAGVPTPGPSASTGPSSAPPAAAKSTNGLDTDSYVTGGAPSTKATEAKPVGPVLTGAIRTDFPIDDLGSIVTRGRWATGFSLDGAAVRLLWVTARRVNDAADKKGFEVTFFLHGPAIGKFRERLQKSGATSTSFPFYGADPAPGAAEGKSTLLRNGPSWNPTGQALMVNVEDKYTVHFMENAPEALKGVVRIRVYGDDAASNASFAEVVNKLGLQHVFAPPTPNSLERYKLTRFLWAHQPELLESALWAGFTEIDQAAIDKKIAALDLGPSHAALDAIEHLNVSDATLQRRLKLGQLLWSRRPKAFIDWAKSDYYSVHGILPSPTAAGNEYGLNNALQSAGITTSSPEYKAALEGPAPSAADAKKFFLLGFLIRTSYPSAEELMLRNIDQVTSAKFKSLIQSAGIDVKDGRLEQLSFDEVYPGYFTVYDPQRPERLKEKGARYLYSTLDNPERVFEVLTGGQKASLTRFQEGKLVHGKSSAQDFNTGGAFSVFTRLVTESVIEQAKKHKKGGGGGYAYNMSFGNWGGSRPYKVILNRAVLGRLDWYGYNGDNFGRSTGLSSTNHSEKLIETINKSYSSSNELMFPVGNDPKFFDFVVCENESQKTALVNYLTERGITSVNGKPLSEFVRIETFFFEHPDDLTVDLAVREACEPLKLEAAEAAVRAIAGPYAKANAAEKVQAAAHALASEMLNEIIKSLVNSASGYVASQQASQVVNQVLPTLPLESIETAAVDAGKATAAAYSPDPPANFASGSEWSVQSALTYQVQNKALELFKAKAPEIAEKVAAETKAAQPAGADNATIANAVRTAVYAQVIERAKLEIGPTVIADLMGAAVTSAEQQLRQAGVNNIKWTLNNQIVEAAVAAAKAQAELDGTLAGLRTQVLEKGLPPVKSAADASVKSNIAGSLKNRIQSMTKPRAEAAMGEVIGAQAREAARNAAAAEIAATVKATAEKYNAAHPSKAVPLSGEPFTKLVEEGMKRADDVAKWFIGVEVGTSIDPILNGAVDAAVHAKASADQAATVEAISAEILTQRADQTIDQQLRTRVSTKVAGLADEVAGARAEVWAKAEAPGLAKKVLENLSKTTFGGYNFTSIAQQLAAAEAKKITG